MFVDPVTFQKIRFVYPKSEESMEELKQHFDMETLPVQFGGRNDTRYDHEEFSRMMTKDDLKAAALWGLEEKPENGV